MADPISAALIAGSSLLSAKGQMDAGKAENAARQFNAKMSERNAVITEQEAFNVGIEGDLAVQKLKEDFESMRGEQKVALMASGWSISGGTPLQLQLETAAAQDEDIAKTEYNVKVAQATLLEQAAQDKLQAQLERFYGATAKKAARTQAMATLLSGGQKAYKAYG